jgi:excisionase family DNA binding protein
MPLCYSVKTAAEACSVSERTIHNAIRDGRLAILRIGRRVLIPPKSLQEFLEGKTAPTSEEADAK